MATTTSSGEAPPQATTNTVKHSSAENEVDKVTGEFIRKPSKYRNKFSDKEFPPEGNGRYHLFVSYACPWSTRCLLICNLKGLDGNVIGRSVCHPNYQDLGENIESKGWVFSDDPKDNGAYTNNATEEKTLRDVYLRSDPNYIGKYTVPCLYDTKTHKVVNNESSDIMYMLNTQMNHLASHDIDTRPPHLEQEIERLGDWLYPINNGVYQCGFARTQEAYDKAAKLAASRIDECEALLENRRYIAGDVLTEADLRLFSTLVRWDSIYFVHFKCCFRRMADMPNLHNYILQIYQHGKIRDDIPFDYIRRHYYQDHRSCNPHGIVPLGPFVNLEQDHNRGEIDFAKTQHLPESTTNTKKRRSPTSDNM